MKRAPKPGWHKVSDAEIAAECHKRTGPRKLTAQEAFLEARAWEKIAAAQPPTGKDQIRAADRRAELKAFRKDER